MCRFLSVKLVKQVLLSEVCGQPAEQVFSNDSFPQAAVCVCVPVYMRMCACVCLWEEHM